MIWGTGKAPQRVDASIRHMHCGHSAYSNPTCALRAPFASHTFHSCFDLCRAREKSTQTTDEHSVDNPNVFNEATNRIAMHASEMTLAYLRGELSTCSAVWVDFGCFTLKFIIILMQLFKNFLWNFKNYVSNLPFKRHLHLRNPVFDVRFCCACL